MSSLRSAHWGMTCQHCESLLEPSRIEAGEFATLVQGTGRYWSPYRCVQCREAHLVPDEAVFAWKQRLRSTMRLIGDRDA